jgi:anti-sigma regulatory factor (Ser/Thr protein kinase)
MAAHWPYLEPGTGWHWLIPAAEMAGLARSNWRPSSDPALAGWACLPRVATRSLGADPGSVRAARDFAVAILQRWGMAERSTDVALVVSELMTNALRHAGPGSGDTGPRRPIRLGLVQPGPCVLCAVADPGRTAPAPQRPGSRDETGRGLQLICALTDRWGYTTPSESGKVVWALFRAAGTAGPGPVPRRVRPRAVPEPRGLAEPAGVNCPSRPTAARGSGSGL